MDEYDKALRAFFEIQGDYKLDEDDYAYRTRKRTEQDLDRDELERYPWYGIF